MPFSRPTLTTLRQQAAEDITASGLPGADGFLRLAALPILGKIQAGFAFEHYGYLDWIALQATPFTASGEYLEGWAAIAPTPVLRLAPQKATGAAQFTGLVGKVIPSGTVMTSSDAVAYASTASATIGGGGTVSVAIAAVVAAASGDAVNGIALTLSTPIAGINSAGSAVTDITGGTDLETDDALRSRMLESYAAPPAGGSASDYVTWALAVPGVSRAWTLRNGMGPGTVVVYFMEDAVHVGGLPVGANGVAASEPRATAATGDQLAVANHIYPLQPVTALVYAAAPVASPLAITISGLSTISGQKQAAVSAAIAGLLVLKSSPLADSPISQSDVDAAISAVAGVPPFAVTSPTSWPVVPAIGALFTLGTVTFA
jgi:uncharacterized phage protein gp47/JayE